MTNLKDEIKKVNIENRKVNKENVNLLNQVSKLKGRKKSASISTTTVPLSSAEASISTLGVSSFSITKLACSQFSQTDSHPEIPYSIEEPL